MLSVDRTDGDATEPGVLGLKADCVGEMDFALPSSACPADLGARRILTFHDFRASPGSDEAAAAARSLHEAMMFCTDDTGSLLGATTIEALGATTVEAFVAGAGITGSALYATGVDSVATGDETIAVELVAFGVPVLDEGVMALRGPERVVVCGFGFSFDVSLGSRGPNCGEGGGGARLSNIWMSLLVLCGVMGACRCRIGDVEERDEDVGTSGTALGDGASVRSESVDMTSGDRGMLIPSPRRGSFAGGDRTRGDRASVGVCKAERVGVEGFGIVGVLGV